MIGRSARPEVRNPLLGLPSVRELASLGPEVRARVYRVLRDISADASERAEKSWRRRKAPMAAYWKAVSVYARHLAAAIRKAPSSDDPRQGRL